MQSSKNGKWISKMSSEQVEKQRDRTNGVILLPIGSTEQHGRHLPLGTDAFVAETLVEEVSKKTDIMATPPFKFGWSPHHLALPGSISIKAEHLIEVVYDIIESLALHDFQYFVIVNGHRIVNVPWMQIAAERCQRELGVKLYIFDPAYASKSLVDELGFEGVGHAEEIETSHMLHCHPELVNMDNAEDFQPEETDYYHIDPSDPRDTLCYVPSTKETIGSHAEKAGGVKGGPTESSAEKGKIYHDHLVSILMEIVETLRDEGTLS